MMKLQQYTLHVLVLVMIFLGASCEPPSSSEQKESDIFAGLDHRTKVRMQNYYVNGYRLYQKKCANCHQSNGEGLRKLYPPLHPPSHEQASVVGDPWAVSCMIKYGINHGNKFDVKPDWEGAHTFPMPANPQLKDIEIAEILTYIHNAWGNRKGFFPVKEVRKYLSTCTPPPHNVAAKQNKVRQENDQENAEATENSQKL